MMSWYVRSLAPGDVHRGVFDHGSVRAACGVEFFPVRVSPQQARCFKLPAPEQVCPACLAQANDQVVIPATCSAHPEGVIDLVVRGLGERRIELESHAPGGCALTVDATLLFDVLGEWLG
ncbi:MAG: hypothetical protein WBF75_11585 [Pseudonocardiaceae bacterium]